MLIIADNILLNNVLCGVYVAGLAQEVCLYHKFMYINSKNRLSFWHRGEFCAKAVGATYENRVLEET